MHQRQSSTTPLLPPFPSLPTPTPSYAHPTHASQQRRHTPPTPRTRALAQAGEDLPGLGLGLPYDYTGLGQGYGQGYGYGYGHGHGGYGYGYGSGRYTTPGEGGPSYTPHSRNTSESHPPPPAQAPYAYGSTRTTSTSHSNSHTSHSHSHSNSQSQAASTGSGSAYPSWLPRRPVGPGPEGWWTESFEGDGGGGGDVVLPGETPSAHSEGEAELEAEAEGEEDLTVLAPVQSKRSSATQKPDVREKEKEKEKDKDKERKTERRVRVSGAPRLPSFSFGTSAPKTEPSSPPREKRHSAGERQATPRRVIVRGVQPPPPARTSEDREPRITFPTLPSVPYGKRHTHQPSSSQSQPPSSFGRNNDFLRPESAGSGVQYHPPSPSHSAAESSTGLLPVPVYKHPLFRPELLLDPTWSAKAHYRLLPVLAFAHLPAQVFLDIHTLYILVLSARFPPLESPTVPSSGRNWALATAAYAGCVFLQLICVFLLYEILYCFYRRWRASRPSITSIYLSRPASTFVALSSFAHFSFLNQVRRSAWRSRSPRAPGGWRDGLAETCYLYSQNGWTVATLLPRGALALALLLAFWLPPPGGTVFQGSSSTTLEDAKDGLYFLPSGALTTYAKTVLALNAAWALFRTTVLLLAWLGLWALSGLACAGLCGPRNKWEETRWGEKEKEGLGRSSYAYAHGYGYGYVYGEGEPLPWGWRERTRERIREAWEFCLADRSGRRLGAVSPVPPPSVPYPPPSGSPHPITGVEETRPREGPRMSLDDPTPEPAGERDLSRIMQHFLAGPLSQFPLPPSQSAGAGVQSPQQPALVGSGVFGPLTASGSGSGSGGQTVTALPTPALGGQGFAQTRQEMRVLPSVRSQQPELVHPQRRESVALDLGEAELAARVQKILLDWVDPDEDDTLAQALLGNSPRSRRQRTGTGEHERELARDEQRRREKQAIDSAQAGPVAVLEQAQSAPGEEGAGQRRSYPPEEGRSASMSSLGQPLLPGQSQFEYFRPGSRTQSTASGSAAVTSPTSPTSPLSRGGSQSISNLSPTSPGHAHTDSNGSQAISDPGVPMLATRFNPSMGNIARPQHAHHPPSQSARPRAQAPSSGESSLRSVAAIFVGRPAGVESGRIGPPPALINEDPVQEHDPGEEGDEEEVSPEEESSEGGPSRGASVSRLMRPSRSLAESVSSGSNSISGRVQAEPELLSSSGGPNRQLITSDPEGSYYSSARSQAQSPESSPEGSRASPIEGDEEPIVDRTFGRQSDWTSQLEAEETPPPSARSSGSTRPSIIGTPRRQASVDTGSPNLTIRRELPAGTLTSTLPAPIPIRSPPSSHLRPQPSGETISAASSVPPLPGSSANDSFVTAPIMQNDADMPPPVRSYGAWLSRNRPEGESFGGNPM
ncbi:hypothetical protein DACRYDRAFT_102075 [Dacryopinax primogenitus]|uniref:Uncharacterized protein n=1 Tax=Dacryopinax primogenitus (strain DJM 731) TaxID=1858805 RepID=M5FP58_DACPD|nr:uncharacterized protein DACRYDRAFT_102075 [Dacryopinax primogenitus]EJT98240.1 hypothetical protein DACRYDRAFT_102075 [Dacryopinax primogenitus]